MGTMRTHTEQITVELAAHEAGLAAGELSEDDEQYLTEVARLTAAYAFRLYDASTDKDLEKHKLTFTRVNHWPPRPEVGMYLAAEIDKMAEEPAYLRECLAYAAAEQRIRRTAKRRRLSVEEVFANITPEECLLVTPEMVSEVMERLTTVTATTPNLFTRAVLDVWRIHADSIYGLGEQVAAYRALTRQLSRFTVAGLTVTGAHVGGSARSSSLTLRTPAGRVIVASGAGSTLDGSELLGLKQILDEHDNCLDARGHEVRTTIAVAIARTILEQRQEDDASTVSAMFRGGRVNRASEVSVIVTVGDRGPTLKVTPAGVIHEAVYDSDPAIGAAFLEAAARHAGVDPAAARAFLLEVAEAIRTDADVVSLLELEPAGV